MSSQDGKFSLGAIEILPSAQQALQEAGEPAAAYLYHHQYEAPDEQAEGESVVSVFHLSTGAMLYIITDVARVHTVVMTAADARPQEAA
ncbi:MAG: hypothetical protein V9H69_21865 [Anaerolineae bacterium]